MMHINFGKTASEIESIDVEPFGSERKEIEEAAKRYWNGKTSKVRATLAAAGVAELNGSHPHSARYAELADDITVTRELIKRDGIEYVRVTITEDGR